MSHSPRKPHHLEVHSSLEDSTYDLLSDVSSQISDDDGRTTSIASTDERSDTPDELEKMSSSHVMAEGESEVEDEDEDEEEGGEHDDEEQPTTLDQLVQSTDADTGVDSALTARALSEPSLSSASTSMAETTESFFGGLLTKAIRPVAVFDEVNMPEPLRVFQKSVIKVSTEYVMAEKPLRPDAEPFNILFLGDHTYDEEIMRKIGSALAVSTEGRSPRKHIVQIGSFQSSSPEVHLFDSYGPDMVDQRCETILMQGQPGSVTCNLVLDSGRLVRANRKSTRSELEAQFGPGHVPNLVVVCYSHDLIRGNSTRTNSDLIKDLKAARDILCAVGLPTIDVSTISPFEEHVNFGLFSAPSLCVRFYGLDKSSGTASAVSEAPVSPELLLDIDSKRLSRHLNCIRLANSGLSSVKGPQSLFPTLQSVKQQYGEMISTCSPANMKKWFVSAARDIRRLDFDTIVRFGRILLLCSIVMFGFWLQQGQLKTLLSGNTAISVASGANTSASAPATSAASILSSSSVQPIPGKPAPSTMTEMKSVTKSNIEKAIAAHFRSQPEEALDISKVQILIHNQNQVNVTLLGQGKDRSLKIKRVFITRPRQTEQTPLPRFPQHRVESATLLIEVPRPHAYGVFNVTVDICRGLKCDVASRLVDFGSRGLRCPWGECIPGSTNVVERLAKSPLFSEAKDLIQYAVDYSETLQLPIVAAEQQVEAILEKVEETLQDVSDKIVAFDNAFEDAVMMAANRVTAVGEKYVTRARKNGANLVKKARRISSLRLGPFRNSYELKTKKPSANGRSCGKGKR